MKSYIHFIRHGITEGNLKRWYYGSMDIPLAEEGLAAINELKAQAIYPPLKEAKCYTSGLIRTEQTLQAIYGDVPHETMPLLREMNFGAWEGKTFEELKSEKEFDAWVNTADGSFTFPGGGDSIDSFYARICEGLKELLGVHRLNELSHRHNGRDAVSIVVCHGGVIAAIMENLFPGERENFWQWIPDPGHGYTVYFENSDSAAYEQF